ETAAANGTARRNGPHSTLTRRGRPAGCRAPLRPGASTARYGTIACDDENEIRREGGTQPSADPGGEMSRKVAAWLPVAAAGGAVTLTASAQPVSGPDDRALVNAAESAEEWLTYGRDYAETRFSPLEQIDER